MDNSIDTGLSWDIDTSYSVTEFIAKVEKSMYNNTTNPSSGQNSIGYEELPRTKADALSGDEEKSSFDDGFSHSSWDDDTLSSNFCSDNETDQMKRKHGTRF